MSGFLRDLILALALGYTHLEANMSVLGGSTSRNRVSRRFY